ncbi:unnamed protein product [Staurois parvus]|uniref:Uncharacterized protein n=1 Tax=Staurois parvus TaxID=386267 RepID=A0ABN9HT33_9NEOB|nr:unnamed protein product [Staurois parvus]
MGPLCPCPNSKKPMKKVPGHLMGPPTDPGPSGSARVSKWSVCPCLVLIRSPGPPEQRISQPGKFLVSE